MAAITDLATASSVGATTDYFVANQNGTDRKVSVASMATEMTGNRLFVDATWTANSAAKRFTTIASAVAAASAGDTIFVATGTYSENVTLGANYVKIIGAGMPTINGGTGRLEGGTIIRGYINCAAKVGVVIQDLGIDLYGVNSVDGITASNTTPTWTYQTFRNLYILGNGYNAASHGILCSGGACNTFDNIKLQNWYHGIALRGSNNNVSNIFAYCCTANSIIVKSATTSQHAYHNTITNVVIDGNDGSIYTRGGPIRLESTNASHETRYNTVSNVSARNTGESVILCSVNGGGVVSFNTISNVTSYGGGDGATRADFDCNGATDIVFTGCMSLVRDAGYGFRTRSSAARISAIGCSADTTGAGRYYEESGTKFDWLDLGGGQPVYTATFNAVGIDQGATAAIVPVVTQMAGTGAATNGASAEDILTCTYTGAAGDYAALSIDLLVSSSSGGHSTTYRRTISCSRAGTSTLEAAISTLGTDLVSAAGAQGSATITVNTSTANVLKVRVQAASYDIGYSYTARIVVTKRNVWQIANAAA